MTEPAATPLPPLPREADAPTFREPWQAKAFALVVLLHRQGRFAWEDWVRTLSGQIAAAPQRAGEDADSAYHRQFLAALETMIARLGLARPEDLEGRKEEWRRAYLNTPHGHAVDLAAARRVADAGDPDGGAHDLVAIDRPVAVSPGRATRGACPSPNPLPEGEGLFAPAPPWRGLG